MVLSKKIPVLFTQQHWIFIFLMYNHAGIMMIEFQLICKTLISLVSFLFISLFQSHCYRHTPVVWSPAVTAAAHVTACSSATMEDWTGPGWTEFCWGCMWHKRKQDSFLLSHLFQKHAGMKGMYSSPVSTEEIKPNMKGFCAARSRKINGQRWV